MKKISYILLLSIWVGFSLASCESELGEITGVTKAQVFPGVPHGHIYLKYTAQFKVNKPLKINKLELILSDGNILIEDYKIINTQNNQLWKGKDFIAPGNYRLVILLPRSPILDKEGEKLQAGLLSESGKQLVVSAPVKKTADIYHR